MKISSEKVKDYPSKIFVAKLKRLVVFKIREECIRERGKNGKLKNEK